MSHRLHHTEGLILGGRHYGEANTFYQILTPDLGLIGVSAQGVRYLKSKLRSQLRDLSHAGLTLVRGREVWRLTGAETSDRLNPVLVDSERIRLWNRVARLVRRLMPGEQAHSELFADLLAGLEVLGVIDRQELDAIERILVLRLLHRLGYVRSSPELAPWLAPDFWPKRLLVLGKKESEHLITVINYGLSHSQL